MTRHAHQETRLQPHNNDVLEPDTLFGRTLPQNDSYEQLAADMRSTRKQLEALQAEVIRVLGK